MKGKGNGRQIRMTLGKLLKSISYSTLGEIKVERDGQAINWNRCEDEY